jgi:hypothetical protein
MVRTHNAKPLDVPEDVMAEMDIEERRQAAQPLAPVPDTVPEEVRSELDREARVAGEEERLQLTEGAPPAVDDESRAP